MSFMIATALIALQGCCQRADLDVSPENRHERIQKIYRFDTRFYPAVSRKYREQKSEEEGFVRLTPKGHLITIGVPLTAGDSFVFMDDLIVLSAPTTAHRALKQGYKDLMKSPLQELTRAEYKSILEERKESADDSGDPFFDEFDCASPLADDEKPG